MLHSNRLHQPDTALPALPMRQVLGLCTLGRPGQPPEERVEVLVMEEVQRRRLLATLRAAGALAVRASCRVLCRVPHGASGRGRFAALLQYGVAHKVARGGNAGHCAWPHALSGGWWLKPVYPATQTVSLE